jgi:hypothetical protein
MTWWVGWLIRLDSISSENVCKTEYNMDDDSCALEVATRYISSQKTTKSAQLK